MSDFVSSNHIPCPTHLLDEGETAIWWDRPDPKRYALRDGAIKILVALFMCCFSIFWISFAVGAGGFFWMFGLIPFGAGIWQLSEPFRKYRKAFYIQYLLTDTRAVIATPAARSSTSLSAMKLIEVISFNTQKSDILFLDQPLSYGKQQFIAIMGSKPVGRDGFIGIADADKVEREMRRLQALAAA